MNWAAVAPHGSEWCRKPHFSLFQGGQRAPAPGSVGGRPTSRHPASVKRENRVEERKLLPERATTLGITAEHIRGHLAGIRSLSSLSMCGREERRGSGRADTDQSEPPQFNQPSLNGPAPSTRALFLCFSLCCQLSVSSLSLVRSLSLSGVLKSRSRAWCERGVWGRQSAHMTSADAN